MSNNMDVQFQIRYSLSGFVANVEVLAGFFTRERVGRRYAA